MPMDKRFKEIEEIFNQTDRRIDCVSRKLEELLITIGTEIEGLLKEQSDLEKYSLRMDTIRELCNKFIDRSQKLFDEQLNQPIRVAVLGNIGSGKRSFIKKFTRNNELYLDQNILREIPLGNGVNIIYIPGISDFREEALRTLKSSFLELRGYIDVFVYVKPLAPITETEKCVIKSIIHSENQYIVIGSKYDEIYGLKEEDLIREDYISKFLTLCGVRRDNICFFMDSKSEFLARSITDEQAIKLETNFLRDIFEKITNKSQISLGTNHRNISRYIKIMWDKCVHTTINNACEKLDNKMELIAKTEKEKASTTAKVVGGIGGAILGGCIGLLLAPIVLVAPIVAVPMGTIFGGIASTTITSVTFNLMWNPRLNLEKNRFSSIETTLKDMLPQIQQQPQTPQPQIQPQQLLQRRNDIEEGFGRT